MTINWNIRWKNPTWWKQLVVGVFAPILTHAGMSWSDVTSWAKLGEVLLQAVQNPVVVVAVFVAVFNTMIDPTTPGLSDSERAMSYTEPGVLPEHQ